MSAAARARRLDESAEIIIFERQRHVSSASCGLPYFVGGEITDPGELTVQTPDTLRASLNLDVGTEHEVIGLDGHHKTVTVRSAAGSREVSYDALVLAPGTEALRPPIPGLDSPRVRTLRTVDEALDVHARTQGLREAVVLGAGFIGVEVAEALANLGVHVTLVEAASHVLPPLDDEIAAIAAEQLRDLGIELRVGVLAQSIEQGELLDTVTLADGSRVGAQLIVLATGVRPATAIFENAGVVCDRGAIVVDQHGRTNLESVWAAGDATRSTDAATGVRRMVALAGPANRAGRLVADDICGVPDRRSIPATVGTAIVRIGPTTVASTGANRRMLSDAGIPFHTISLYPNQHASYFPGAETLAMLIHFGADGRLLGGQAAGREGVDKRIDVLATAIRAGFAVADLIDLDLAYSPPFGSAKDPINMAGMIGENVLGGRLKLWYAQDYQAEAERCLILDVRSHDEFAAGHLQGALNIPHPELRDNLDLVRATADGRPVRVLCASGMRSYLAHRVLHATGFDSASLSGGMMAALSVIDPKLLQTECRIGERVIA
jgi:NADPH-dependent 2,4-dienoyl-CoA reductase/sulfur reductase-like enzyme/rhodanese-related sulfurtransferase